jgi:hypothetical protein
MLDYKYVGMLGIAVKHTFFLLVLKHTNYVRLGNWIEAEELRIALAATLLEHTFN